jgi:predicted DNA-binding WGR domain protein
MIAQPYHRYVERIDAARNMARFYALSVQPTLFGNASLLPCCGRIGSRDQQKIHLFEDGQQAVTLFLELAVEKRKEATEHAETVEIRARCHPLPHKPHDIAGIDCQ